MLDIGKGRAEQIATGLAAAAVARATWDALLALATRFTVTLDERASVQNWSVLRTHSVSPTDTPLPGRLTGANLGDLVDPASWPSLINALRGCLARGYPALIEITFRTHPDPWHCTVSLLHAAADAAPQALCLFECVQAHSGRVALQSPHARQRGFDEALAHAQMAWFERDLATDIGVGSPSLAEIYGLDNPTGPWHYDDIRARILPSDIAKQVAEIDTGLRRGVSDIEARVMKYRIRRPDGLIRDVEVRYRNLFDNAHPYAAGFIFDVTEANATARQIREDKIWLDVILNTNEFVLWEHNLVTGVLRTSANWAAFFELPVGSWTQQDFLNLVQPEDLEVLRSARHDTLSSGAPYRPQFRLRGAQCTRWLESKAQVQRNAKGEPVRLVGCTWDITVQVTSEQASRGSDARLTQIARLVPGSVFELVRRVDGTWALPYTSANVHDLFGVTPEAGPVTVRALLRQMPPEDRKALAQALQKSAETTLPLQQDLRVNQTSGPVRWLHCHAVPKRQADGTVHWYGHLGDVTQQRKVVAQLRQSEFRLQLALTAARMTAWEWDLASNVFVRSGADASRFRRPRVARSLKNVRKLIHPEDLGQLSARFLEVANTNSREAFAVEHRVSGSPRRLRWVETYAQGIFDAAGKLVAFAGVTQDITQRHAAEDERKRMSQQVMQAQKMESIGMLTGGIAHDFNNMLGSILGYAGLAIAHFAGEVPTALGRYMGEVVNAGERARELVAQLMAFSRGESAEITALSVGPAIDQALRLLRSTLPSRVEFRVDLDPQLPLVFANGVQLQQVLVNLCVNARDAIVGAGVIRVGAYPVTLSGAVCASCFARFEGGFVSLSVADNGAGIPEAQRLRVFEPFFTTKAVGQGSGMGLAVIHGIVHGQGGHVLLASTPGSGTKFEILLPVAKQANGVSETAPPAPLKPTATAHILLVDDDEMVARVMTEILTLAGHTVASFTDPQAALEAFSQRPAVFDLVIADLNMPGLSGVELAAAICTQRPQLPILILTGYLAPELPRAGRAASIRAVLPKPIARAQLLTAVAAAVVGDPP